MLVLTLPEKELWDERNMQFIKFKGGTFVFEHSLISISKWESITKKAFLPREKKSSAMDILYIKCMLMTPNADQNFIAALSAEDYKKIRDYIADPMTATVVRTTKKGPQAINKVVTSEQIYSWMVDLGIPFSCEKWHLNRLLKLIEVCRVNGSNDKMSKKDIAMQNAALNKARLRGGRKG